MLRVLHDFQFLMKALLTLLLVIRSGWVGVTLTEGGSNEMVFFRPRLVVPGTLGPIIDEVYLIISVSGGSRTPPRIPVGSLKQITKQNVYTVLLILFIYN